MYLWDDRGEEVEAPHITKMRRDRRVRDLRELTDEEVDKFTIDQMLQMEEQGIAKMPEDVYKFYLETNF